MFVSEPEEDSFQDSYEATKLPRGLARYLLQNSEDSENAEESFKETQNARTEQKLRRNKTANVIEAIRQELSDSQKEAMILQKENKKLKKENSNLVKELDDVKKEMNSLQLAKKSEQRTKEKFRHLKQALAELKLDSENKEKESLEQVERFQNEVLELQRQIDEQEMQKKELIKSNRNKDEEIGKLLSRILELEQSEKKLGETVKISELKLRESERVLEFLKKQPDNESRINLDRRFSEVSNSSKIIEEKENILDSLAISEKRPSFSSQKQTPSNFKTTLVASRKNSTGLKKSETTNKPHPGSIKTCKTFSTNGDLEDPSTPVRLPSEQCETTEKKRCTVSLTNDLLKAEWLGSVTREQSVIEGMDNLISKESKCLLDLQNQLSKTEASFQPEIERWIKQFEELKQKLTEKEQTILDLLAILEDCQHKLSEHITQRKQEKESYESQLQYLNEAVIQLKTEVETRDQLLEKILPYGNSVLSGASITSNEQVTQLKKSNEELEAENKRVHEEKKNLLFHFEDLKTKHNELFESFIKLRGVYLQIEDQLGLFSETDPEALNEASARSHDSSFPTVPTSEHILKKIQEILAQSQQLAAEKEELIIKLNSAEQELSECLIEADKQKIENHIESLDFSMREMTDALDMAKKEIKKLKAESTVKSNQMDMQKKLLDDKNYELILLTKELDDVRELSSRRAGKIQELEQNLKEVSTELVENKAKASQNEWALNLKLQEMVVELVDLKQKTEDLETQNGNLSNDKAAMSQEKEVLLNSIKNHQARLEQQENEILTLESKVRNLEQDNAQLKETCATTKSRLENSQSELDKAKQTLRSVEEANQNLKNQLLEAQKEVKTAEEECKKAKAGHKNEIHQLKEECDNKALEVENLSLKLRKITLEMNQAKESQNSMTRETEKLRSQLLHQQEQHSRELEEIMREINSMPVYQDVEVNDSAEKGNKRFEPMEKQNGGRVKVMDPSVEDIKFRLKTFIEKNCKSYQTLEQKIQQYDSLLGIVSKTLGEFNESSQCIINKERLNQIDAIDALMHDKRIIMLHQEFKSLLSNLSQKMRNKLTRNLEGSAKILEVLLEKALLSPQKMTQYQALMKECSNINVKEVDSELVRRVQEAIEEIIKTQKSWAGVVKEIESKEEAVLQQQQSYSSLLFAVSETSKVLNLLSCNVLHRVNTMKGLMEDVTKVHYLIQKRLELDEDTLLRDCGKNINSILFSIIKDLVDQAYYGSNELADLLCLISQGIKDSFGNSFTDESEKSVLSKVELQLTSYWRREDKLFDKINDSISQIAKESDIYSRKQRHSQNTFHTKANDQSTNLFHELFKEIRDALEISKGYISSLNKKNLANSSLMELVTDIKTIYEALDATVTARSERFLKEAEISANEVSTQKPAFSQEKQLHNVLYKMNRASVSKLQEECLVFRNAFRLLDLNPIIQKIKYEEEGEFIKKKLEDNKAAVDKILNKSHSILNYSTVAPFEENIKDDEITKLVANMNNIRQLRPKETRTNVKNDIRLQIIEMLKEVGGFRVVFNLLLYICTKYESLLKN